VAANPFVDRVFKRKPVHPACLNWEFDLSGTSNAGSWRRMLLTEPPIDQVRVAFSDGDPRPDLTIKMQDGVGVLMGDVVDAVRGDNEYRGWVDLHLGHSAHSGVCTIAKQRECRIASREALAALNAALFNPHLPLSFQSLQLQ